jgi:hypothetical protein
MSHVQNELLYKIEPIAECSINDFARDLIGTKDLDPVYPMLVRGDLPEPQLHRFLMAYWCYYHVGVASHLSEFDGDAYWKRMAEAAANQTASPLGGRWPRASERRHFRGEKCAKAVRYLAAHEPSYWVNLLLGLKTHQRVMSRAQTWPMFGPWIGFKIADMLEIVCGAPITFSCDIPLIYEEPRACLDILSRESGDPPRKVLDSLIHYVGQFPEPAAGRRACGVQEAETALCKYKGYLNGHYFVGKDTKEIRHALTGWGTTADHLKNLDWLSGKMAAE